MLYRYLIEIRHTPQHSNGAYRRHYQPFNARTPENALVQAIKFCKKNAIDCVGFDVAKEFPVNRRERFKLLKQRRLDREQAQAKLTKQLMEYDPSKALVNQEGQLA